MDAFGPVGKRLTWETDDPQSTVNFLDLSIIISDNGTITTKTYQKEDNKYLYSTPDSYQPKITLKNFVYGTLHQYFWQSTKLSDYNHFTNFLFDNMIKRGHIEHSLKNIFKKQSRKAQQSNLPIVTRYPKTPSNVSNDNNTNKPQKDLQIHLPHHRNNSSTEDISNIGN